jgi:uncharacterized membrane protein
MRVANPQDEIEALKALVAALTARVYQLEQASGLASKDPQKIFPAGQQQPEAPPPSTSPSKPPPGTMLVPPPAVGDTSKPPTNPSQLPKLGSPVLKPLGISAAARGSSNIEEKIGQYWLNRIGIVAILIGVSYFLKFAFENNWIGPGGRIAIGLLAGIGLVLWGERFRRRGYATFSYSLMAVGIGTLYLSLWGAFQVYHLIPAAAAFVAMVIVTAATIALAWSQDAELLASFALVGGFATPALLSTGENHEVVLFSYVCLLDIAILLLAIFRPWRRLLWGSFAGTIILYVGWYSDYYSIDQRGLTVFFASGFAALFAVIPLVTHYEKSSRLAGPSLTLTILPLLNATWLFLALYVMYERETVQLTWYAIVLAAVYLAIGNAVKNRFPQDDTKLIHLLHVAIAVAFLTIAIPARLNAHWITIGWLVESAALLWVSVKTKTDFLRYLAVGALTLGIVRMLFFDQIRTDTLVFNARFATYLVAIAVLGAIAFYGKRHASDSEMIFIDIAVVGVNLLALIALTWEASDYFDREVAFYRFNRTGYHEIALARGFTYSAIWLIYGAVLMALGFWKRSPFARWQALILIALTTAKVFLYDVSQLGGSYRIVSFIALGAVLLGISFVYQRDWLKLSTHSGEKPDQGTTA